MKKLFIIAALFCSLYSCTSAKVTAPASNTTSKPGADTALQGDSLKNPVKQQ